LVSTSQVYPLDFPAKEAYGRGVRERRRQVMVTTPNRPDQLGTLPQVPQKKKHTARNIVLGAIAAVIVLTIIGNQPTTTPAPGITQTNDSGSTTSSVDILNATLDQNPAEVAQYCNGIDGLRSAGMSDEVIFGALEARDAFSTFAGTGMSDRLIFETVTARC
jgi:hypothetical protein